MDVLATLQQNIIGAPVFSLPSRKSVLKSDTDAGDKQLGCMLTQDPSDGAKKPLGDWSRTLSTADQNSDTTNLECLAIVWVILVLISYLQGQSLRICTNYDARKWILNLVNTTERLARWRSNF